MTAASNKETFVAATPKAARAREVFGRFHPEGKAATARRKDILAAAQAECDLSPAAAATYYQSYKDKLGLVQRAAPSAAAQAQPAQ